MPVADESIARAPWRLRLPAGVTYRAREWTRQASLGWTQWRDGVSLRMGPRTARAPVTAVVVGRNDDYMPDFTHRLRTTIEWNGRYVREVVFIEWNPPGDRPLLSPALAREFPFVRAFVVPAEVHRAVCQNDRLALMEYHAKNAGVRRATQPWVVATNADIAFGADTVMSLHRLVPTSNAVGTAQRIDIPWADGQAPHLRLWQCIRRGRPIPYDQLGTGDFLLASQAVWQAARGYDESLVRHRIGCDVRGTAQMVAHGAQVRRVGSVFHLEHPTSCVQGIQPHHGEMASLEGVPYTNPPSWGLADLAEAEVAERVWRLG